MSVAGGSASVVVRSDRLRFGERGEGADVADGCEPIVLDPSMHHQTGLARCAGDWRSPGVCLQRPSVAETAAVVTKFRFNVSK